MAVLEIPGIAGVTEIIRNPDYETLFQAELSEDTPEKERGTITDTGAVAIRTGKFTGRSPRDKYIVKDEVTSERIWWHAATESRPSDNHPLTRENFDRLQELVTRQLSNKRLFVVDAWCGTSPDSRLAIRFVTEIAWQAHFVTNMFIAPTEQELSDFSPDFFLLNGCKTQNDNFREMGMNSEVFIAFDLSRRIAVIGGTWYGGEMKKGIFSVMNFYLPQRDPAVLSMHCSANTDENGLSPVLFFGLSGTGKTTLSTDAGRLLVGDDEHGWDETGIFNLEGGCYAKTYRLNAESEPEIRAAVRRNALLENVFTGEQGQVDFYNNSVTENGRVSYPITHIPSRVTPASRAGHPEKIIFLTADAWGVIPAISLLSHEQAIFHFLSGYTAKVAGTERGITEPVPVFSACFGAAFLSLHPLEYAELFHSKLVRHNPECWLINTGWIAGNATQSDRIPLKITRTMIRWILNRHREQNTETSAEPYFGLEIPRSVPGIDPQYLQPGSMWKSYSDYCKAAEELARLFRGNFQRFSHHPLAKSAASGMLGLA